MVYFTCNKTNGCDLKFMGFNINLQTHLNLHQQDYEHSITISPNTAFCSKMISNNKYHIIINLDGSGSMCGNIGEPEEHKSRINLAKECLKELVMFLYTLVTEGKQVFISLIVFNSSAHVKLEYKALTSQEDCIKIMTEIDSVVARGTTDMGSAIIKTMDISHHEADETFKILISDGYITTGLIGVGQIKEDYPRFYNSTIGIGNENHYDKLLLQELSNEEEERSCFNSEEMKEQIIDSVFSNVSKIAKNIIVNTPENIMDCITSNKNVKEDGIINTDIKFTTKTFMVLKNNKCDITINNVPKTYIDSTGNHSSNEDIIDTVNSYLTGDITVSTKPSSEPDHYNIKITIDMTIHPYYKSSTMEKSFRNIQRFIDISNDIIEINLNDISSFASNFKKNKKMLDKITNLIKYTQSQDSSDVNNYMLGVLYKFKASIEPFTSNSSFMAINDPALCTPLRMCRSQTSSGSYAFAGRQVSMGYSMSASNLLDTPVPENFDEEGSETKEDEFVMNLPNNSSGLYPGALYPGAKI